MKTKLYILIEKAIQILPFLFSLKTWRAIWTWPKFSISAYVMVSCLLRRGICPLTVIDVGANVGQFTFAALNLFKCRRLYAFEPVATCAQELRQLAAPYRNVYVYPVALGAECKKTDLYINAYRPASSLFRINDKHRLEFPQVSEGKKTLVDVYTLDHYFSNLNLHAPVLLKIDVQGAEKLVLEGGRQTLKQVNYVLLEVSFTPMYIGEPSFLEIIEVLNTHGFKLLGPMGYLKSPKTGDILQSDLLFQKSGR